MGSENGSIIWCLLSLTPMLHHMLTHFYFTPLVTSVDGMLGKEIQTVIRAASEKMSQKWHKPILAWWPMGLKWVDLLNFRSHHLVLETNKETMAICQGIWRWSWASISFLNSFCFQSLHFYLYSLIFYIHFYITFIHILLYILFKWKFYTGFI